jgi:hypothetical protein
LQTIKTSSSKKCSELETINLSGRWLFTARNVSCTEKYVKASGWNMLVRDSHHMHCCPRHFRWRMHRQYAILERVSIRTETRATHCIGIWLASSPAGEEKRLRKAWRSLGAPHGEEVWVEHIAGDPGVHPAEHAMRPCLKVCSSTAADAWIVAQEAAILPCKGCFTDKTCSPFKILLR